MSEKDLPSWAKGSVADPVKTTNGIELTNKALFEVTLMVEPALPGTEHDLKLIYRDLVAPYMNRQYPDTQWYFPEGFSTYGQFLRPFRNEATYTVRCYVQFMQRSNHDRRTVFGFDETRLIYQVISDEFTTIEDAVADLRGRMHVGGIDRVTALLAATGLSEADQETALEHFLKHALGVTA